MIKDISFLDCLKSSLLGYDECYDIMLNNKLTALSLFLFIY